jgi:hypothetical protein
LKNSPSEPPRSGIHVMSFQFGASSPWTFVQAAMNSGKRLK